MAAAQRWRAALEQVELRLVASPDDPEWLDRKVALLRRLGREQAAYTVVEQRRDARRLAEQPEDAALAYEAGELAAHLGDPTAAVLRFEIAARLAPDDARPVVAVAALDLVASPPRLDAAAARLAPILGGAHASGDAWFHQGLIEEARHDSAAARIAYARAVTLAPDHVGALCNDAALAAHSGDIATARLRLEQARTAAATDSARRIVIDRELARLAAIPVPQR